MRLVVVLPGERRRVLAHPRGVLFAVVEVVDGIASVHDGLPAALEAQAHGPEGLEEGVPRERHQGDEVPAHPRAVHLYVVAGGRQVEDDRLLGVPALGKVEGHAIVRRIHEAAVLGLLVDWDAGRLEDAAAVLLQFVLLLAPGIVRGFVTAGGEMVNLAAEAVLDEVRALGNEDRVVVVGSLVVDEVLDVGVGLVGDLLEEVLEHHLRAVHVARLLAELKAQLLEALAIHLSDIGDDADAIHEFALLDVAEVLGLRVADGAAGTVAADEAVEDLHVLTLPLAILGCGPVVVGALHLPGRHHVLGVGADRGVVVAHAEAEVHAQQESVLQEEAL
mmetsp:Transcript_37681/g.108105  ORF Transcript_37681/g.108105 Transcript_37681/m.108105 type:complete len:333 (-) Transcript_37681:726-1724(-)